MNRRPPPVRVEGALTREELELHNAIQGPRSSEEIRHTSFESTGLDPKFSCRPLSQWDCLTPRDVPKVMQLPPKPVTPKVAVAHSSTVELTRFQRFIRRMENAGPKIVLDRLKEEWQDPDGEDPDEEVCLFVFSTSCKFSANCLQGCS